MSNQPIPMVHIRKFTLHSLTGHSIGFKGPNESVMVPPEAVEECMKAGAAPASEVDLPDNSRVEQTREERLAEEPQGEARKVYVQQVMRDMVGLNDPNEFDANGTPKVHKLNEKLGFKIPASERNEIWNALKPELTANG